MNRLPELDPKEYSNVQLKCKRIESVAFKLGEQLLSEEISSAMAEEILRGRYPCLSEKRISQTLNQARYFAWK